MVESDRASLAIGLLVVSLFAYLVHLVVQWRRLSHVPGPFWAALSKGWMVRESLRMRQPISFKEVNDKYGMFCVLLCFCYTDGQGRFACACRTKRADHRRPGGDAKDDGGPFRIYKGPL